MKKDRVSYNVNRNAGKNLVGEIRTGTEGDADQEVYQEFRPEPSMVDMGQ